MAIHFGILILAAVLDFLIGDPRWIPHPICAIGWLIAKLETLLRKIFPDTKKGKRLGGVILLILVSGISTVVTLGILWLCRLVSPILAWTVECVICYLMLAARSLQRESMKVYKVLKEGSLDQARHAVSMIVGRDTENLDKTGVVKATVETVAENASDGVIAPLIFMAIGGAPLGVFYKACNTMDSMVGYRNEKYADFGCAAALWDDVLNFIPARISGIFMSAAAFLGGFDGKNAFRVFWRDRRKHKSPNSAHTEAACAGALGIQLAGGNFYFGKYVDKPTIGDGFRPVTVEDIPASCRLMFLTAGITVILFCLLPLIICIWKGRLF